jgi:hypothetical protein
MSPSTCIFPLYVGSRQISNSRKHVPNQVLLGGRHRCWSRRWGSSWRYSTRRAGLVFSWMRKIRTPNAIAINSVSSPCQPTNWKCSCRQRRFKRPWRRIRKGVHAKNLWRGLGGRRRAVNQRETAPWSRLGGSAGTARWSPAGSWRLMCRSGGRRLCGMK